MRLWIPICILLLASPAWGDLLSEGLALFEAGEHAKAHKKLSAHLASHPDSPRALFYLGRTETDGAQAQELFRMLMAKHPKHELADDALFQIAQYYYARGFYVTARQHFLRLLDTYPQSNLADRALYRLGLTLLATDEFEAARTRFARMMERHPESPWAPYAKMGMVDAYFGEERYEGAIRAAESLLTEKKNDPVKSNVLYVLAQCYDKLGKKEPAEAARRRIARECPKSYEATLNPLPPVKTEKASSGSQHTVCQTGPYTVQVGAFGNPANATRLVRKLTTEGYEVRIHEKAVGETILHLVRVGGYPTRKAAKAAADDLHRATGLACRVVKTWRKDP
jgi:TolA-binding protein